MRRMSVSQRLQRQFAVLVATALVLAIPGLAPKVMSQQRAPAAATTPAAPASRGANYEARMKEKINGWTVGLAAGQLEGAPLRFSTELARVMDDGDNMRVVSVVTRGVFDNIFDLLYLRGIDAAIVYGDVLEHFRKDPQISNITTAHQLRDEPVPERGARFRAPGNQIARGPRRQGRQLQYRRHGRRLLRPDHLRTPRHQGRRQIRSPSASRLGELAKNDKYAAVVFVSSKPLDPFVKRKWPEGFKFLPIPLTEKLEEYYAPADLEASDYPDLVPKGQKVATISVPAVLAVYDWPSDSERHKRMVRFVDYLFARFPKLQTEAGYHPKWKDLNLAATVPGWTRFRPMQAKLDAEAAAKPKATSAIPPTPGRTAEQERQFQQFLQQNKQNPKQ